MLSACPTVRTRQARLKATRRELEWIVSHEKILLCFDTDAPGRETAKALAELIASQSTVAIMDLPRKDAAELLIHGEEELWWKALSGSKPYRPECIVEGKDISLAELRKPKQPGYELPYPQLQRMTWGYARARLQRLAQAQASARVCGHEKSCTTWQRSMVCALPTSLLKLPWRTWYATTLRWTTTYLGTS